MVPKACGERRGGLVWSGTVSVPATGVQNSSHLGASGTFTMPFTFSLEEYADMIYLYGFCDGNSVIAVAEYRNGFRIVEYQTGECLLEFIRHCEIPVDFPAFVLQPTVVLMKASMKKALFVWYTAVHVRVREELQDVFMFPTRECGEHSMQRACIHITCSECNISDGSSQLHRYILFTDEAQFNRDGVNNTHNSNVWGDVNPHATVESNFQQRFSVNVWCAVLDDQLIGPFILEALSGFEPESPVHIRT